MTHPIRHAPRSRKRGSQTTTGGNTQRTGAFARVLRVALAAGT